MKKLAFITAALLVILLSSGLLAAQNKDVLPEKATVITPDGKKEIRELTEKEKKEVEKALKKAGETMKKAMKEVELEKVMEEVERALEEVNENMNFDLDLNIDDEHFFYNFETPHNDKSSSLSLSKHLKGEPLDASTTFTVEEGQKKIKMTICGESEKGNIFLSVILPSGEVLKKVEITPLGDVSWSHNIYIKEEEKEKYKDHFGDWKITVKTKNATGHYSFNLKTY